MDYQNIFQRVEEKYLVNREQFAALNAALGAHMEADPRGQHTISNVYYDTDDFALVRHSLEKPLYKEKLRLRCYGKADAQTVVFPEIKKKFDGVVYKRRVAMPLKDAERFLATGLMKAPQQQIHREIADFRRRCEIFPKAFIAYDRVALFDPADEALRSKHTLSPGQADAHRAAGRGVAASGRRGADGGKDRARHASVALEGAVRARDIPGLVLEVRPGLRNVRAEQAREGGNPLCLNRCSPRRRCRLGRCCS